MTNFIKSVTGDEQVDDETNMLEIVRKFLKAIEILYNRPKSPADEMVLEKYFGKALLKNRNRFLYENCCILG